GTCRIGDGRTGHAGEDDADEDVDLREAAAEATDEHLAEVEQAVRDAAGVHDVRSQDEQRHRQQHEGIIEPVEDLLAEQADVAPGREKIGDGGHDDGQGHRHAEDGEADEGDEREDEDGAHGSSPAFRASSSCQRRPASRLMRSPAMATTATMKTPKME